MQATTPKGEPVFDSATGEFLRGTGLKEKLQIVFQPAMNKPDVIVCVQSWKGTMGVLIVTPLDETESQNFRTSSLQSVTAYPLSEADRATIA